MCTKSTDDFKFINFAEVVKKIVEAEEKKQYLDESPITEPEMVNPLPFKDQVQDILNDVHTMLLDKNEKYGNSALDPKRIFSKAESTEQIRVRIDDKLSRIQNDHEDEDEDAVMDLLGYLVLLRIAEDTHA